MGMIRLRRHREGSEMCDVVERSLVKGEVKRVHNRAGELEQVN